MKSFWDAKARENPMYYVSSFRAYDDQDPDEFWKWGGILAERFLDESGIEFDGSETMLEIGCGIGRMTQYFSERFATVHAIDVSSEMIDRARAQLHDRPNVHLSLGNGHDLSSITDATLDFVFSYIVLQHIPREDVALGYLREMGRVLRPGGHIHVQFSNLPRITGPALGLKVRRIVDRLRSWTRRATGPTGLSEPAWVGSRLELGQIREACDDAGLEIMEIRGQGTQYCWVTARRR